MRQKYGFCNAQMTGRWTNYRFQFALLSSMRRIFFRRSVQKGDSVRIYPTHALLK